MLCKIKTMNSYSRVIGALLLMVALFVGLAPLTGCSSEQSDEEVISASLTSELDAIKNLDDGFINDLSESVNMSQLSLYGIDGVEFMKSYLEGFDYSIDSITVDGDTATAQITLTCKSYTGYQSALRDAVDEITSNTDVIAGYSESDINERIGDIVVSSLENVELKATEPITIDYTKNDGVWQAASSTSGDIASALITN